MRARGQRESHRRGRRGREPRPRRHRRKPGRPVPRLRLVINRAGTYRFRSRILRWIAGAGCLFAGSGTVVWTNASASGLPGSVATSSTPSFVVNPPPFAVVIASSPRQITFGLPPSIATMAQRSHRVSAASSWLVRRTRPAVLPTQATRASSWSCRARPDARRLAEQIERMQLGRAWIRPACPRFERPLGALGRGTACELRRDDCVRCAANVGRARRSRDTPRYPRLHRW